MLKSTGICFCHLSENPVNCWRHVVFSLPEWPSMCVRMSSFTKSLRAQYLRNCLWEFYQIYNLDALRRTKMNWLDSEITRSKVKVTARPDVGKWAFLTNSLWELPQIYTRKLGAVEKKDELITFWGQKVKVEGNNEMKHQTWSKMTCSVVFLTGQCVPDDGWVCCWRLFTCKRTTVDAMPKFLDGPNWQLILPQVR